MLFLLSPAKSLDYETPALLPSRRPPKFMKEAAELVGILRQYDVAGLASLMDLSEPLAALNVARFAHWRTRCTARNSKAAVLAFDGDVYAGLNAASLSADQLDWADRHLLILSGLYGVLQPLDALQPYRLEMGTSLPNPRGKDLYAWWGERVSQVMNARHRGQREPVVVNLASQEYARVVDRRCLKARMVDCVFEDWKNGEYKIISFFAKRARGLMARHAIVHQVETVEALKHFQADGYGFDERVSGPDRLVFRRRAPEQG